MSTTIILLINNCSTIPASLNNIVYMGKKCTRRCTNIFFSIHLISTHACCKSLIVSNLTAVSYFYGVTVPNGRTQTTHKQARTRAVAFNWDTKRATNCFRFWLTRDYITVEKGKLRKKKPLHFLIFGSPNRGATRGWGGGQAQQFLLIFFSSQGL